MYKNLKKHMKDKKIFQWDLAVLLELSESRVRYRFSKQSFKNYEMCAIRDKFFPEVSLDELFKWE